MGQRLAGIAVLIVAGTIVADLVTHPTGTGILVNGIASLWQGGLNATLGSTTDAAGKVSAVGKAQ